MLVSLVVVVVLALVIRILRTSLMVWTFGLVSLVGMTQAGGIILGVETVSL